MIAVATVMNGHAMTAGDPADDPLAELRRLEAELAATRRRVDDARQRAHANDVETRAALRDELAATRGVLADVERAHAEAIAELRAAADAQLGRIAADIRRLSGEAPDGE